MDDFDGPGFGPGHGFGMGMSILARLGGLFFGFLLFAAFAIVIVLLVRYLLVATRAAHLYIERNTLPRTDASPTAEDAPPAVVRPSSRPRAPRPPSD